jgi:hypothetical protein
MVNMRLKFTQIWANEQPEMRDRIAATVAVADKV